MTNTIQITYPTTYQLVQRDESNQADIVIVGRYTGKPTKIQARWNNGPWTNIVENPSGGAFRGVLANRVGGQGALQVRFSNATSVISTVNYVGVGDIFVMAGQSNMSGRGSSNHQYTPTTVRASVLGNNDRWADLKDPYDSAVGATPFNKVSNDAAGGSFVALFANMYIRRTGVPVAFLPVARGGSTIEQWARVIDSNYLYGSMYRRIKRAGGTIRAVLWCQGENNSNTSAAGYQARLEALADAIAQDFRGAPTVACMIGSAPYPGEHRSGVRMGTLAAIAANDNLLLGPSLYDINIDDEKGDGMHFRSNADLIKVGTRWFYAVMKSLHDDQDEGLGPVLTGITQSDTQIRVQFDQTLQGVTANVSSFWVMDGNTRIPVQSVSVDDDTVVLEMGQEPPVEIAVSYGHDNRSAIGRAVYNSLGLPAVPFYREAVS